MLDYIAYPPFHCAVTAEPGGRLGLAKLTGSQRQKGMMWADAPRRGVFLGTIELGDERRPMAYGADVDRDVAGVVERVGDARWRDRKSGGEGKRGSVRLAIGGGRLLTKQKHNSKRTSNEQPDQ